MFVEAIFSFRVIIPWYPLTSFFIEALMIEANLQSHLVHCIYNPGVAYGIHMRCNIHG